MSRIKLRLVGCLRYNYKGELYEKGKVYSVGEVKGTNLLRDEDEYGRPYFAAYTKPTKSKAERVAEAAAAAAAKAATQAAEEIIDRPDGSEPVVASEIPEGPEEESAEEVDTDDDPALDEEDESNPEEIDVGEDEDRSDGSEVEV